MTLDTRHFTDDLATLAERLLAMGGLAEERLRGAVQALADRDRDALAEVAHGDGTINALHVEIDDRAFKLLALHQPVAVDLRTIVAVVKINADLERVGDLAVNIAEAADEFVRHPPVTMLVDLRRMGAMAQGMLRESLDAFVSLDLDRARRVLAADDELDALKNQVFRELLAGMLADPRTIEPALDLMLVSRHLERVGDHATNIAEDVIFMVEARDVRHHAPSRSRA